MRIVADLHMHSAFAGGALAGGRTQEEKLKRVYKRFIDSATISVLKGVNYLGTGDVQYKPWLNILEKTMINDNGFYIYNNDTTVYYILQTEIIFTAPFNRGRKITHVVILFPDFESVHEFNQLLDNWGVAHEKMARPFIVCSNTEQVSTRIHTILDLHPLIEIFPAHIMTPEGVFGGNQKINNMSDFFGDSIDRMNAVETGLSADPYILGVIPELDKKLLISNSDAHSSALNRLGREFTIYNINTNKYKSLIDAIRSKNVDLTAEFHPTEGRYFLTGHRSGKNKHNNKQYCYFSPKHVPKFDLCPICNKQLTIGVLQRVFEISKAQGDERKLGMGPKRKFITMIPLVEIISHELGIKTITSKKVMNIYNKIIEKVGTEAKLWTENKKWIENIGIDPQITQAIMWIKSGNFTFDPPGYDGNYGKLVIGKQINYEDISIIQE